MAQAVSRRSLNAEAQFRSQTSSCEVFVGHSGTGTSFSPSTSVSPVTAIPPTLHTHLQLHVALTRRTHWRSLGTFQKSNLFLNRGALVRKVLSRNI